MVSCNIKYPSIVLPTWGPVYIRNVVKRLSLCYTRYTNDTLEL